MPFAVIDGRRIEYRSILGTAGRPTLVFLHEGLGCAALWRDFPDKVARRLGSPAVIYSRFGYGQSDPLDGKRDVDFMHREAIDVLPALLSHLGIQRPLLIGHSDGASIALIFAAQPEATVTGLVLMAPHVFVEAVTVASIARIAERYETTDLRQRLSQYHAHVDDAFRGWADIWLNPRFRAWSLGAEVTALRSPTLLIQGDADEYGSLTQLDAFSVATSASITRLVLPKCGHAPHRDQEATVIDAVAAFSAGL